MTKKTHFLSHPIPQTGNCGKQICGRSLTVLEEKGTCLTHENLDSNTQRMRMSADSSS